MTKPLTPPGRPIRHVTHNEAGEPQCGEILYWYIGDKNTMHGSACESKDFLNADVSKIEEGSEFIMECPKCKKPLGWGVLHMDGDTLRPQLYGIKPWPL
jgi:hypothetical protein